MDMKPVDDEKPEAVSSDRVADFDPKAPQVSTQPKQHSNPNETIQTTSQTTPSQEKDVEPTLLEKNAHTDVIAKEDFSVFTMGQKKAIIVAGSFLGLFSPVSLIACVSTRATKPRTETTAFTQMTGTMYYPALNSIAADLNVSSSQVNITVTTYLVSLLLPFDKLLCHTQVITNLCISPKDHPRPRPDDDSRLLRHRRPSSRLLYLLHHLHHRQPRTRIAEQLRRASDPAHAPVSG